MELLSQTPMSELPSLGEEPTPLPVSPEPILETQTSSWGENPATEELGAEPGIESALDLYERQIAQQELDGAAPQNGEAATEPQAEASIDWNSDKVKQLGEMFKDVLGVDLKSAHEMVMDLQKQQAVLAEQQAERAFQEQVRSLQDEWGVNEAELNRRLNAVVEYAQKLPEGIRQQVDNPEGFKLLWSRLEGKQAAPKTSSRSSASTATSSKKYVFKKSEINSMMMQRPEEYSARQGEIAQAFALGQVLDDA